MLHIVGVDPGIVHTGVVRMSFETTDQLIVVTHVALAGCIPVQVANVCLDATVFVEDYRPRGNVYGTDAKMRDAVARLKQTMPKAKLLDNTGVKKVVTQDLMELLGVWKFSTPTHHQDLRSAARIALYGMLKDNNWNQLLSDIVRAKLDGGPWKVVHA